MRLQTIHLYNQGVVVARQVPADIADQALSKFQREGYTCWKVDTPHPYAEEPSDGF